jgi:hypothetical protein
VSVELIGFFYGCHPSNQIDAMRGITYIEAAHGKRYLIMKPMLDDFPSTPSWMNVFVALSLVY